MAFYLLMRKAAVDVPISTEGCRTMLAQLANVPTETLIDMLAIILTGERMLSSTDVTELEQIQRELQRRARDEDWKFYTVN